MQSKDVCPSTRILEANPEYLIGVGKHDKYRVVYLETGEYRIMSKGEAFICETCGGEFTRNARSHRKYCNACNKANSKRRTKERRAERKFKRDNQRYNQYVEQNKLQDPAFLGSHDPRLKFGWNPTYYPIYS